uniref:Uncharacterized protein n=1 Tax=Eutreptiella gymnastica TaxID=73025 RepID=A0A7S1NV07_9EUGL
MGSICYTSNSVSLIVPSSAWQIYPSLSSLRRNKSPCSHKCCQFFPRLPCLSPRSAQARAIHESEDSIQRFYNAGCGDKKAETLQMLLMYQGAIAYTVDEFGTLRCILTKKQWADFSAGIGPQLE